MVPRAVLMKFGLASACWVRKPKTKFLDHVSNHNSDQSPENVLIMLMNKADQDFYEEMEEDLRTHCVPLEVTPKEGKSHEQVQSKLSMNYKPVVIGNQSNGNAGTKACDDVGKARMETKVTKEPGKEGGDPSKEDERDDQEKDASVNSTNNVNATSTNEVNAVGRKASIKLPDEPNMPALEDIVYSDDDEDVGAKADINNLDAFMPVSPIPTTRVHKNHPVEQIIGDLNSAPQTRRMTKNLEESSRTQEGKIEEEVYVCQPPGFEDPNFPDRVYKVEKALYGLHQAPRAWYETLLTYLLDNRFQKGKIDKTLFIKRDKDHPISILRIEQFWAIVKVKTINREVQLQALVDGKKIIVTEASVRRDLQLNDEEGMDCLQNANIFEELTRMGSRRMGVKRSANPIDPHHTPTIIQPSTSQPQKKQKPMKPKRKDTEMRRRFRGNIDKTQSKATLNEPSSLGTSLGSGRKRQETMGDTIAQSGFKNESKTSNDSLLVGVNTPRSDEDSLKLKELMEFCTKLQQRVLDLENTKTTQALEITSLKLRVKKLEKKGGSRTHKLKRLYKVGLSRRVESSKDEGLDMFGVHDLVGDELHALAALKSAKPKSDKVMLQEPEQGTITTKTIATTVTAASTRPKAKELVIHEQEQATTPTVSSQQPS
ncbi:ribonuclease H-like domain-containing protein [Tanacetum coccineum]